MKQRIDPARAAALYAELGSARAAARTMGRSVSGVWRALKRAGVAVMGVGAVSADPRVAARRAATAHRWWCDDAARAARGAAIRTALADPAVKARHRAAARRAQQRRRAGCAIPDWVPEALRPVYADIARRAGEEAAAKRVRQIKAHAARQSLARPEEARA